MSIPTGLTHLLRCLEIMDKRVIVLLALVIEGLVFWLDHFTEPLIPFGPYYFLPIGLAAWCVGMPVATVFIVLSSIGRTFIYSRLFPEDSWHYYF